MHTIIIVMMKTFITITFYGGSFNVMSVSLSTAVWRVTSDVSYPYMYKANNNSQALNRGGSGVLVGIKELTR